VEGALATAVRSYEAEVAALEARLLPCLRSLLHKLSRGELNVLRHCKSTLNKLLGRMRLCRKVRRPPAARFACAPLLLGARTAAHCYTASHCRVRAAWHWGCMLRLVVSLWRARSVA